MFSVYSAFSIFLNLKAFITDSVQFSLFVLLMIIMVYLLTCVLVRALMLIETLTSSAWLVVVADMFK